MAKQHLESKNGMPSKNIKQRLVRGLTPEQIRKAFDNKPEVRKIIKKQNLRQSTPQQAVAYSRPSKATRVTSQHKNPRLLLDVPVVTSQAFIPYRVPEWFETKEKVDVSIIIPMYKSSTAISKLIDSWQLQQNDATKIEIIYVDDCCPSNSKDVVLSKWMERRQEIKKPIGKIIFSPENQGFGVSCNIGARYATGDYLIFLNADTMVTPGWIGPILRQLNKQDVGIVGNMQLKSFNATDFIDSAGSEWSWSTSSFQHIGKDCFNGKSISGPFALNNCPKEIFEVQEREMVTGACFGIRKELFKEIGGFNPNYRIAYWEDAEICMQVKELEYKVIYQPNSRIYHTGHHSNSGGHRFNEHNKNYFLNKWVNSGRIDKIVKAKRPNTPDVKSIVIRRQAAHGDVLVAAAIAPALKKMYPDCKIVFSTLCTDVVDGNPYIDKVVNDQDLSERSFHLYYNLDMAYEYRPNTNILKSYADIVGVSVDDCKLFLKTEPIGNLPDDYIVFHSGMTNWAGRDWSQIKFDILSSQLQKEGHKVVCVGTGRDNKVSCDLDLRGKTNIAQLSHVIKNAKLFVGIDSFPMHIAQTFDVPGVCFFGSIDPKSRLISDKMKSVVAKNVACLGCHHKQHAPCVVTSSCETQFLDCINQVSVGQMMTEVQNLLK